MHATAPSFTDAIYLLLGQFAGALKARGAPEHSIRAYIFGGCAVHLYAKTRVSSDLDLEVETALLPRGALYEAKEEAGYVLVQKGPEDEPDLLELDLAYNSTLGPLHEDFSDRAETLELIPGSPLVVLLPSREDLALSKLGRFSDADIGDILTLMSDKDASWELFERLTNEAQKYYVGPPRDLTGKLEHLITHRRGSAT